MEIEVKLREHFAEQIVRVGSGTEVVKVPLNQYYVDCSVNKQDYSHVGYVGTQDNAPINFLCSIPPSLAEKIKLKVEGLKGQKVGGLGIPPRIE